MIEVEVHQQLQHLMRQSPELAWPHQLTMARLVARGLRLGRNALIQVPTGKQHRLSYLLPALMWPGSTVVSVPEGIQEEILREEIPWLQQALDLHKPVRSITTWPDHWLDRWPDRWPDQGLGGLALVDPQVWLQDRLGGRGAFPTGIPVVMDGAEHLESWARQVLTTQVGAADWLALQMAFPPLRSVIGEAQVQLSYALLRRPGQKLRLHQDELGILRQLRDQLQQPLRGDPPEPWGDFLGRIEDPQQLYYAEVLHETGQVYLRMCPVAIETYLSPLWQQQPFVLVGTGLDVDREAGSFRARLGVPELTTLRFWQTTQDPLPLMVPRLPVPNSPLFQSQLGPVLKHLICEQSGSVVVLVSDRPLQAQIGADLAAEFGSRVQVNRPPSRERGILVADWEYWLRQQGQLGVPHLLVMVTLPFPSTEDPEVAARVESMRQQGQDWFRAYLLPLAAAAMQRAISPLRTARSRSTLQRSEDPSPVVAILDNRIVTRSYGSQLLEALGPTLRTPVNPLLV